MTARIQIIAPEQQFLTTAQLSARWNREVKVGTLENWRAHWPRKGPRFVKLGDGPNSPVVYRLSDVIDYERRKTIKTKS